MRDLVMNLEITVSIKNFQTSLAGLKDPPVRLVDVIVRLPLRSVILAAHRARGERLQDVLVNETHVIPEYVLRFEQLQTYPAAQAEYFPVQTQDVHLELDLAGKEIGAKLTDEGIGMVFLVDA